MGYNINVRKQRRKIIMTITEKIEMYKRKKQFVDDISNVLGMRTHRMGIMCVEYEVYRKTDDNRDYFVEFVVVVYDGGGQAVRCVSGNSNYANYIEIGKLLDGGYYDEIPRYRALTEEGFTKIRLED
jgi:hypothetical protein